MTFVSIATALSLHVVERSDIGVFLFNFFALHKVEKLKRIVAKATDKRLKLAII